MDWLDIVKIIGASAVGVAGTLLTVAFGKPVAAALKARARGVDNEVTQQVDWAADLVSMRKQYLAIIADRDAELKAKDILLNMAMTRLNSFKVARDLGVPVPKFAQDSDFYDPAKAAKSVEKPLPVRDFRHDAYQLGMGEFDLPVLTDGWRGQIKKR